MRALIFEEQGKDFDAHVNWAKYYLLKGDKDVALNEYFGAFQINEAGCCFNKKLGRAA